MLAKIFLTACKKIIEKIEKNRQGALFWLGLLYFVCIIKAFVGWLYSWLTNFALPQMFLAHWPLFYFNIFISISLILWFFTGEKIQNTTKAVFAFSFLVLIVPIADFFAYGINVSRIYPMSISEIAAQLFSLFGLLPGSVLTLGQGIAFWSAEILIAAYVLTKTNNWKKAFGAMASFCFAGLFFSAVPFFASSLLGLGNAYSYAAMMYGTASFLILAFLFGILWLFAYDKKLLKKIVLESAPSRAAHYVGLALIGWLYGFSIAQNFTTLLCLFFSLFSVFAAFEGCLLCNNIYDRHLKKEARKYWNLCFGLFAFSIVSAYLAGMLVLAVMATSILIGILYSLPPVRLKRLGFLNNAVIGLLSALVFFAGFLAQNPNLSEMPLNALAAVFVTFSLAANVKDLKDYEDDKREGIKTLPVLLGRERGLELIAMLTSIAFLIPPIFLGFNKILVLAAIFAIANYALLKKAKEEKVTFLLYYAFMALFAIALLNGFV